MQREREREREKRNLIRLGNIPGHIINTQFDQIIKDNRNVTSAEFLIMESREVEETDRAVSLSLQRLPLQLWPVGPVWATTTNNIIEME